MNNKIKLVYGYEEDINSEEIDSLKKIGEIKDIIPIIFPPCRNSYFFSNTIEQCFANEWGKKLAKLDKFRFRIASIYDTCGVHPLFFIIKLKPNEDITETIDSLSQEVGRKLNPSLFSFTSSPKHIIKRLGTPDDEFKNNQNILLEKYKKNPKFIERLENIIYEGYNGQDLSGDIREENIKDRIEKRIKEERERINQNLAKIKDKSINKDDILKYIKFTPIVNIPILSMIFLNIPSKDYLQKLKKRSNVIDIYKIIGGWDYAIKAWLKDIQHLYDFLTELHEEGCQTVTKCAMRIWREEFWTPNEPILAKDPYKRLSNVEEQILNILVKNEGGILFEKSAADRIHILRQKISGVPSKTLGEALDNVKKRIYKYSIKLDRPGWRANIVFIKAALGKKEKLKDVLRQKLLGSTQFMFSRRYYQITGAFDFIIIVDTIQRDLEELKDKISSLEKEGLIEDVRILTTLPSQPAQSQRADSLEPSGAAFLNAILPNAEDWDNVKKDSVRSKFYNYYLYDELERSGTKDTFEPLWDANIKELTPEGTIFLPELDPHEMLHVFVRFKMADNKEKEFNQLLNEKQEKLGSLLKIYRLVYYPNTVMCLLTANDFKSLFEFTKDLDEHSKSTEISLIFNQGFPSKIPREVRCKPCIFPQGSPCEACPRYNIESGVDVYSPKNFNEFEGKLESPVKVAIIPMNITEDEFIDIQLESLNKKETSKKEDYSKKILNFIKEAVENDASIIVFPELSVPLFAVEKIEKEIKKIMEDLNKEESALITVAGSHYKGFKELIYDGKLFKKKERVYNVSPIIFYKRGIVRLYEQFKNNPDSPHEEVFFDKLKEKNIFKEAELGKGKGCLKFDTECGRIAVLICYDLEDNNLRSLLRNEKVNIVIGVCWEEKYDKNVENRYEAIARDVLCSWLVFANNAKCGGSRLFGPIRKPKTNEARQSLIPSEPNTNSIKYLIIGKGIKNYQDGMNGVGDEHYEYASPRAPRS